MGEHLLFDTETNGLLNRKDLRVHCIVIANTLTEEVELYDPSQLCEATARLERADRLIGHNITGFDIPVLERCLGFKLGLNVELFDTFLASRLIYASNLYSRSIKLQRRRGRTRETQQAAFPGRLLKSHSLEAWGYRLGHFKGDHLKKQGGAQEEFSEELLRYCEQDVQLNVRLYDRLRNKPADYDWKLCSIESLLIESRYGYLLSKQERTGVRFNTAKADTFHVKLLTLSAEYLGDLRSAFPPWAMPDGKPFVPKITRMMKPTLKWPHSVEYVKGETIQRYKMVKFIGSTLQIANRLTALFGWKPKEFTKTGLPAVDEKTLANLTYPPIPALIAYLTVKKRLGQLSEGKQAWMKHVTSEGLIHGRVHATGTRTSRCSHYSPNLGQVPKVTSPYGVECRALFSPVIPGRVMVGADASGLELRMLASRMAFYDGGAFGKILLEGDPHADWMKATGIFIRDNQKTWTYASIYGAGDEKLGIIIIEDWRQALKMGLAKEKAPPLRFARELGKASRSKLLSNLPALKMLLKKCRAAKQRGWICGLDGRVLLCKTDHGSLNDLLQSDGATVMKHAKVLFAHALGDRLGTVCDFLLDVHDEWQLESEPDHAEAVGRAACDSIRLAGEKLGVRVPLAGKFKIGNNWCETH